MRRALNRPARAAKIKAFDEMLRPHVPGTLLLHGVAPAPPILYLESLQVFTIWTRSTGSRSYATVGEPGDRLSE